MFEILYVISMAIVFTSNFMGQNTNYYLRLSIGILWIIAWIIDRHGVIEIPNMLRKQIIPWVVILAWTFVLWTVNTPVGLNTSYVTRTCSNILYIVVAVINAYVGLYFFGKKAIVLSFASLLCTITVNLIYTTSVYGITNILFYLRTVLFQSYEYGSTMEAVSMDLEVQGATMALGSYFVYFLLYHKSESKLKKVLLLCVTVFGLYLGFKRVVLLGVLMVLIIHFLLRMKNSNLNKVLNGAFIVMLLICFGYIVIVRSGLLSIIATYFNVDLMGRNNIYNNVYSMYKLSPFYLGSGFGYVSKYLYDTTGFAVHSEILRLYIDLGCVPFIIWIWYFVKYIPSQACVEYGDHAGRICLTITIFVIATFLVENTLGLFPLHYALALFSMLSLSEDFDTLQPKAENVIG